jgi:hypothetical protein
MSGLMQFIYHGPLSQATRGCILLSDERQKKVRTWEPGSSKGNSYNDREGKSQADTCVGA